MVGAEGTLGIITELTLKLHGVPESISSGICRFSTLAECCGVAIAAIQSGMPLARIELLDELAIRASNSYSKLAMTERPTLFVELHGTDNEVKDQSSRFATIVSDSGGSAFEWSTRTEDRSRLWKARHDLFWAVSGFRPGAKVVTTDACVPISRLAECITETKADLERSDLCGPIVAHAGDGNFHVSLLVMIDDREEVERAKAFVDRMAERAIAMEGTCTGEHGIGQGKKKFLPSERGQFAVDAMRAIKAALDPSYIMNPGKIF
jgi:D-lactate dehydrogenase (cytochrome)